MKDRRNEKDYPRNQYDYRREARKGYTGDVVVRDATFSLEVHEHVLHSLGTSSQRTFGLPANLPTKVLQRNVVPHNESLRNLREKCFDLLIAMLGCDLTEAIHANEEVPRSFHIGSVVCGMMKAHGESQRVLSKVVCLQTRRMGEIYASLGLNGNVQLLGNKINGQAESPLSTSKFDKG